MMRQMFISVCLSLLVSVAACTPSDEHGAKTKFLSEYFTVSTFGEGPDLILVPGLASSPDVWDQTISAFQNTHTLHVIHVSGFAGSDPRGNAGNENILEDLSADLVAYSQTLDAPAHLAGHSLGGLVSLQTALDPHANLNGLTIVDVLPFFSVLIDPNATAETIAPMGAMMKATLIAQSDEVFESRQAATINALVKSPESRELVLSWSLSSDRAVMGQAMAEVVALDLRDKMSGISVPVTVIYARDPEIPNMPNIEALYKDLYAPLPYGTIEPIDDAFHFVMLDQSERFIEILRRSIE